MKGLSLGPQPWPTAAAHFPTVPLEPLTAALPKALDRTCTPTS